VHLREKYNYSKAPVDK